MKEKLMTAAGKLAAARAYTKKRAPYLSPTLHGFVPSPQENLTVRAGGPIAVTERLVLLYEPAWVEETSVEILGFGLAHECYHVRLQHVERGKKYPDPRLANRAADLFINGVMSLQTDAYGAPLWEIPEWVEHPKKYGFPLGLSLGKYYRLLEEHERAKEDKSEQEDPQPGESAGGEGGGQPGEQPGEQPDKEKVKPFCGNCGGVAGNPLSKEFEGQADAEDGRSETECRAIDRSTARKIQEYTESMQGRGRDPGFFHELVEIAEETVIIPWQKEIASLTKHVVGTVRSGGTDYSRRRVSKRSYSRCVTLPGQISYEPELMFIVDSSGSMSAEADLPLCLRICSDVLRSTGITSAWFFEADVDAGRTPVRVSTRDLRELKLHGRGGTNFVEPLRLAEEHTPKPAVVFYLTDGGGQAPKLPPSVPVIWCLVPNYGLPRRPSTWGRHILLSDDPDARASFYGE